MQFIFAIINIIIGLAIFRAIFGLKKIEKVYIVWQNKG